MINLGRNRNHYQGYVLASNLRHIITRPLPTQIIRIGNILNTQNIA